MGRFARQVRRNQAKKAHELAKANRAAVLQAQAEGRAVNPCCVCGAESTVWKEVPKNDPRRKLLPKDKRAQVWADTYCTKHAPPSLWTKRRKAAWLVWAFLRHPIIITREVYQQWRQRGTKAVAAGFADTPASREARN